MGGAAVSTPNRAQRRAAAELQKIKGGKYKKLTTFLAAKPRRKPNRRSDYDWRLTGAPTPEALLVRRKVIEHDLWGAPQWRLHRERMQDAARSFDALLLREADRRRGGRPKGTRAMNPMNVNA